MTRNLPLSVYFSARSTVRESGCVEWTGPLFGGGYGSCSPRFNKSRYAHRAVYENAFGKIPNGMCVCHKCDNKKCINVEHLFIGTTQDNIRDKIAKNRQRGGSLPGEDNPRCKLSDSEVEQLRRFSSYGIHWKELTKSFGIGASQYFRIRNNAVRRSAP